MSRHVLIAVLCLSFTAFAVTSNVSEPQELSSDDVPASALTCSETDSSLSRDAQARDQSEQSPSDASLMPEATQAPRESEEESAPAGGCCKICKRGCPCGDSCISCSKICHKGPGCAC